MQSTKPKDTELLVEKTRRRRHGLLSRKFTRRVVLASLFLGIVWGSALLLHAVAHLKEAYGTPTVVIVNANSPLLMGSGSGTAYRDVGVGVQKAQPPKSGPATRPSPAAEASRLAPPLLLSLLRLRLFQPKSRVIQWVSAAKDGTYLSESASEYSLLNMEDSSTKLLYNGTTITFNGTSRQIDSFEASPNLQYALVTTNSVQNWRHSSLSLHWILDLATHKVVPLHEMKPIAFATWSPTSLHIAFVQDNNVYVKELASGAVVQSTFDGGADIFYGRPDWVYEEEVFGGASALWWAPSGTHLTFLRSDDTRVPVFTIPYFVQSSPAPAYPEMRDLKYPKPGFPNPEVLLMVYTVSVNGTKEVASAERALFAEALVTEVTWVGGEFLVKLTNRESDVLTIALVDAATATARVVRTEDVSQKDGGWFEITQQTRYVQRDETRGRLHDGYIDTIVVDGFNHLAYFSPPDNPTGQVLTSGPWEVVDAPAGVDLSLNLVYFLGTHRSAMDRHVYSVYLNGTGFRNITDTSRDAWYTADFLPEARYAVLSNNGPGVPHQSIADLHRCENLELETNNEVARAVASHDIPTTHYETIKLGEEREFGAIWANAMEIRPASFDPARQYPVLFYVYGGPNSQTVTKSFAVGFSHVVSSALDAIVVTVDGRGTGFMGRKFRAVVRDNLGDYEVRDQLAAARVWADKPYVDANRIAIWGWSYGGYMTLKTLETDAGQTFRWGMAVAPVTTWRFYDSIYTERYMHTPQQNPKGYEAAAVSNVTALGQVERFLLMHGTGDDNVHFQHSLRLLDLLDLEGVENYDVHVFPDSTHSISHHNANVVVYDRMFAWLRDRFSLEGEELYN